MHVLNERWKQSLKCFIRESGAIYFIFIACWFTFDNGRFCFFSCNWKFISRGLTEAQSQKIENRMHLPKQFEIYFILSAKLNIAIKPRREWLLYWGMDWPDGGRQGGGPRREGRQDEMVLRMFYVEHSCLQVGSVLGGEKWAGVKPWVVTKIFS